MFPDVRDELKYLLQPTMVIISNDEIFTFIPRCILSMISYQILSY